VSIELRVEQLESLLHRIRTNAAALAATRLNPLTSNATPTVAVGLSNYDSAAADESVASSGVPSSSIEVSLEDFPTIPPQAPSAKPAAPEPEIRSGLHNVLDPISDGDRQFQDAQATAAESSREDSLKAPLQAGGTLRPGAAIASTDGALEEVTGERPAVSVADSVPVQSPVRTPPPESGPQISPPPRSGYADSEFSFAESERSPNTDGPTIEQLGSTVELDAGTRVELHVEMPPRRSTLPPPPDEEFEAAIPSRRFAGTYDASLAPPSGARAELDAHDRAEREKTERRSSLPPVAAVYSQPPVAAMVPPGPEGPVAWERPPVLATISAAVYEREFGRSLVPKTFLELLDAALALHKP
jgi:hypothetical protein